jgi:hypothetical protein
VVRDVAGEGRQLVRPAAVALGVPRPPGGDQVVGAHAAEEPGELLLDAEAVEERFESFDELRGVAGLLREPEGAIYLPVV